jgi:hypothetical protein
MQARFLGKAEGGEFKADHAEQRRAWLNGREGKELQETFAPPEKDKTAEQRGYYFGVMCLQAGDALGYTKDELDAALRQKHLPWIEGKRMNYQKTMDRLTRHEYSRYMNYQKTMDRLTRHEYSRYIDACIITLAEHGYAVPPPDRNWNKTGWYVK